MEVNCLVIAMRPSICMPERQAPSDTSYKSRIQTQYHLKYTEWWVRPEYRRALCLQCARDLQRIPSRRHHAQPLYVGGGLLCSAGILHHPGQPIQPGSDRAPRHQYLVQQGMFWTLQRCPNLTFQIRKQLRFLVREGFM